MQRPIRTVAPAVLLVTRAEAKVHLRVDHTNEDDLIDGLIAAAISYVDGYSGVLGRALITQTWAQDFEKWDELELALAPVQSVTVTYFDTNNTQQTLATSVYAVSDEVEGVSIETKFNQQWPNAYSREDAIRVTYVAGYGAAASDVPGAIRVAVLMLIGNWYANREAVVTGTIATELPLGVSAMLEPYRRVGV